MILFLKQQLRNQNRIKEGKRKKIKQILNLNQFEVNI
jgi:hypothetical protein